jgi:hypothetical protein
MTPAYIYQRGEPIAYALRVKSGDPSGYTVSAKLKPVGPNVTAVPDQAVASAAEFQVNFVAASGGVPAHWLLTIDAATARALPGNRYIADEKLTFGGVAVKVTEPVVIVIKNSASG